MKIRVWFGKWKFMNYYELLKDVVSEFLEKLKTKE